MPEDHEGALASAEALIASAVRLLLPIFGERETAEIIQQMTAEQARFAALGGRAALYAETTH